ncbi:MAG: FxsA family protein [Myxococcales bacterium]
MGVDLRQIFQECQTICTAIGCASPSARPGPWVAFERDRTYVQHVGRLFLLFTIVPLVELYLLIAIGRVLGPVATIGLVLITGALGAWFARLEGARVIRRWQEAIARHEMPKEGVIDGFLIFVGGLMLITPGILTDVAGLCMVMPPTRRVVAGFVRAWFERQVAAGRVQVYASGYNGGSPRSGGVIEVEGEEVEAVEQAGPSHRGDDGDGSRSLEK